MEAIDSAFLGFEVAGRLDALYVDEGAQVTQGQLLAELDTDLIDSRIAATNAQVVEARTRLELAEATLTRLLNARGKGAITDQDIDEARQVRDAARAGLSSAQAQRQTLAVEREKHRLTAPFAAEVMTKALSVGSVVGAGTPALELQAQALRVRLSVPENIEVKTGDALQISRGATTFEGTVEHVLSRRDPVTGARTALVGLPDGAPVVAGDWVRAQAGVTSAADGYWVPVTALARDAVGWVVYVVDDNNQVDRLAVSVVTTNGNEALIQGQLQAADIIVADGLQRMVPGQSVSLNEVARP